jgi:hypothetical protein
MGALRVQVSLDLDDMTMPGFPRVVELAIEQSMAFMYEQAAHGEAVTFASLPAIGTATALILTSSQAATLRLALQTDAGITFRPGGVFMVIGTAMGAEVPPALGTFVLDAAPGAYGLTGFAVSPRSWVFNASAGFYTLVGAEATFVAPGTAPFVLNAAPGAYALTGAAATFVPVYVLHAVAGSYTLVGVDADLHATTAYSFEAAPGDYALAGADAALNMAPAAPDYALDATPGVYELAGADATLVFKTAYFLNAAAGVYALTGAAMTPKATRALNAAAGAYALTGVAATFVKTDAPAPPPAVPIPGKALWESHMATFGQQRLDYLAAAGSHTFDDNLVGVYYDGARVMFQMYDYLGGTQWLTGAQQSLAIYRDTYVIPNGSVLPGYWNFPIGMRMDFQRTASTLSRDAVLLMATDGLYCRDTDTVGATQELSREIAYALMVFQNAEILGAAPRARRALLRESVYGHFPQWMNGSVVSPNQLSPFMMGLSAHAVIRDWEETADVRALPTIRAIADWLWANAWDPISQSMWYDLNATPRTPAPDLSLLIAPLYAWVWQQTGLTIYRDRGDALWLGGVNGAYLAGGKQFNQNYFWSFDYVTWRS